MLYYITSYDDSLLNKICINVFCLILIKKLYHFSQNLFLTTLWNLKSDIDSHFGDVPTESKHYFPPSTVSKLSVEPSDNIHD